MPPMPERAVRDLADAYLRAVRNILGPVQGLRMMFEAWLQLRGEAPSERRISSLAAPIFQP